ncbi:MAG: PQQ-dependent sugar dehydrogenase [Maricaulis sp.]|jgi:glucose/arabinose dehydrogenase|nr:PQQ-dependent sugar dehydrogenase [Maricaulis sp.]MDG2043891.1 PQQ-dependent sugar dehydrogenase [Maricaulis sp.]
MTMLIRSFYMRLKMVLAICLLACCLFACGSLPSTAHAQNLLVESEQEDFRVITFADGLNHPWSLAFLPNGDMLVSERSGQLRYIDDGQIRPTPIVGLPAVYASGQGGLLGLALHPDFAENRWVYYAYSEGNRRANHTTLSRGSLSEDGTELRDQEILFQVNFEKQRGFHFGGRILFRPDGTLLLTLGDGSMYLNEAQNLGNHLGSVVRLNDDGSVPFDNPFVSARLAQPEIYTYGHRNVQGLARNPATGSIWAHEHGPYGGDEINILSPGRNYGWPRITYGIDYDGTPISELTESDGMEQPIWYWVPSIAPSGMDFYQGDAFPGWNGDVFVGALAGQRLVRYELDGDRIQSEEVLLANFGERIRDVQTGPDGMIYLLTDDRNGRVLQLRPAGQ